jgi:hypothetical protein
VESGQQLSSMVDTAVQRAVEKMMQQDEAGGEEGGNETRQSQAGKELVAELERAAAKVRPCPCCRRGGQGRINWKEARGKSGVSTGEWSDWLSRSIPLKRHHGRSAREARGKL